MNGTILLMAFSSDFDITPNQTPEGKPYPETVFTISLTGTNTSGGGPVRVVFLFRDKERLAANPSTDGSTIFIDLPKNDLELVKDLVSKSILATENTMQLQANYTASIGSIRVNLSLR